MSFFFFFNNRKPVHFEHKPIYYDPEKDLPKSTNKELNSIQGRFIQETNHLKKKKKTNQSFYRSIIRLIIIVLSLIVLGSLILFFE
jgi:hypothetical protein